MKALSDHHQANLPDEGQMQAFREQYGNQAFDQYMQEESHRDEQSEYGPEDQEAQYQNQEEQNEEEEEEEGEAPLAIEYRPDQ